VQYAVMEGNCSND